MPEVPAAAVLDRREVPIEALSGPRELPITLALNQTDYATVLATPDHLKEWALGFCFAEGLIERAADIHAFTTEPLRHGLLLRAQVDARIALMAQEQRRVGTSMSSCGRCGTASEALLMYGLQQLPERPLMSAEHLQGALAWLQQQRQVGLHTALGIDSHGQQLSCAHDIGRHNAIDKVVGAGLASGAMPSLLVVSSRCSVELVQKAVRAGVAALACVSVPSALSVEIARLCRLQLFYCRRAAPIELLSGGSEAL
ncbi:formate dehydrogenase accessory sulfurtransferase FdhD [Carnimonas bestiolae]|uniref:formate dehydrogenase accessory sulfurtransferase FdhD n=1 Tax=Carnimonas bestiolae TaxID=3402172 RepID=UPI003EDB89D1